LDRGAQNCRNRNRSRYRIGSGFGDGTGIGNGIGGSDRRTLPVRDPVPAAASRGPRIAIPLVHPLFAA